MLFLLLATPASFCIADRAEKLFGKKDCGIIVIDEVIGMFFTMLLLPSTVTYLLSGFLIFRVFDISKPFPARWVDRKMKGGIGVVLDDVVAGIYANLVLRLLALSGIL